MLLRRTWERRAGRDRHRGSRKRLARPRACAALFTVGHDAPTVAWVGSIWYWTATNAVPVTVRGFVNLPLTGHDAYLHGRKVEIKATQRRRVSLRSGAELLIVFLLQPDGSLEEIYNGPGAPVWSLVESKPRPTNGQYAVSLAQLRRLMKNVPAEQRVRLLRPLPNGR